MTLPPFATDDQPPALRGSLIHAADVTLGFHRMLNFSVATTFAGTTSFHRVVAWDRSAEVLAEYGRRGREVFLEGHMKPKSRDVDGQRLHEVDLTVDVVHLLGRRSDGAAEEAGQ